MDVNNIVSEAETTLWSVPQGSVLEPLLFLLYINDIYKLSSLFSFYLFADDTSIILSNNNLKELESLVNRELGNVNEWLKANKLSLNIIKSNFVIFRPRKKNMPFIPRIRNLDSVTNTHLAYFFRDCSYLVYDINKQTAPVSILNQFVKFPRTDKMYAFFSRIGTQIWNSIPYSIKLLKRSSFRKKIKELLLNFLRSEDDYGEVSRLFKLFYTLG